jgi:hypothetical protein
MELARRIKAFSLLLLMFGMLVHSVIPHIHHGHDGEHAHYAKAADGHHHHEHGDLDEEHSILLHLLDIHTHEAHGHAFIQWQFTKYQEYRAAAKPIALVEASTQWDSFDIKAARTPVIANGTFLDDDDGSLPSDGLRGPPRIV